MHELKKRPIDDTDLPFLERLYASTRTDELAQLPWSQQQKDSFLSQQFCAQHAHYQQHYPEGSFDVLLKGDTPIGRLYVDRWPNEIRIVDIALLPKYRQQGIGTLLLKELFEEGNRRGVPVSIHVEHFNPALRLYERLGFEHVSDSGVYFLMRRKPDPTHKVASE